MVDVSSLARGALAAGGEGGGGLMDIHVGTIVWTVIIFVSLLFVLGKFAWKPILKALEQRETRIRESLERADRVAADAERAISEQKAELERQRHEMTEALRRTREEAERSAQDLLERARKDAAETAEQARRQVEEERKRAIEQIRGETVEIALAAASHLLRRSLDQADHKRIVDEYLESLPVNLQKH